MTHIARQSAQEGPHSPAPPPMPSLGQLDAVASAFWPITVERGYHGIFPKPGAIYHRQPCPNCSPWRAKSDDPCLVVRIISATQADVICHHCLHQERITA